MACTTILVGKKASYDGSTMIARNDDSGSGHFTAKKFVTIHPEEQSATYKSVLSHENKLLQQENLQLKQKISELDEQMEQDQELEESMSVSQQLYEQYGNYVQKVCLKYESDF